MKRRKEVVLDEDEYVDQLERIIERDFFPELPLLKKKRQYLEALSSRDPESIENAKMSYENEKERIKEYSETADDFRLDEFLSSHTSEDNASFRELMKKAEEEQRKLRSWVYEQEEKAKILAIESGKDVVKLLPWKPESKNMLMFQVEKHNPSYSGTKRGIVNYKATKYEELSGDYSYSEESTSRELQDAREEQDLVWGSTHFSQSVSAAQMKDMSQIKIGGYGFVKPNVPEPGVDASPFVTWGEVDGTPLIVHDDEPAFRVADVSSREAAAHELARKVREKKRKGEALERTPAKSLRSTPGMTPASARFAVLSSAAQRVLQNQKGVDISSQQLRASYQSPLISSARSSLSVRKEVEGKKEKDDNVTDDLLHL